MWCVYIWRKGRWRKTFSRDYMKTKMTSLQIVLILVLKISVIMCDDTLNCTVHNGNTDAKKPLKQRLSPLQGKKFQVDHEGKSYSISICSDVSKDYPMSSVLQKDPPKVLGRYTDTDIVGRESWLLLTYGSGVQDKNESCNSTRVKILITCKEENDDGSLYFVEYNNNTTGSVFFFELQTSALCVHTGLSAGSVLCIIFLTSFGIYFLIGVVYKRIIKGAKGVEQIPHQKFWKELGNLQADGCNFVCRRDDHKEESWRRLTNNFNDPHDERDDALLRP